MIPAEAVEAAMDVVLDDGLVLKRSLVHDLLEAAAPHMREDKRGAALTGGEATFTNEEVDVAATKLYVSSGKTYPWEHLPEAVKAPYIYTAISNLNNQRP